jgi:hypothetical protein
MKIVFKIFVLLLAQTITTHVKGQSQITVGAIVNGTPTLTMTDAQLTDALDFVLNGATLSSSTMETATDSLGQFYYIKALGTRASQPGLSQIAIILNQNGNALVFNGGSGCEMECIPHHPCVACDQVVFERCKRMRCSCSSGSGGCSSRVVFPD